MATTEKDVLFVSDAYVRSVTNISDNVAGNYLLPAIRTAQDSTVQETLGTRLYRHLQHLIFTKDIEKPENEQFKELLDTYMQLWVAYLAVSDVAFTTSYKISNAGVVRSNSADYSGVTMEELSTVRNFYQSKADYYQSRLQDYLVRYRTKFIPYLTNSKVDELRTNLYSAASSGIFLGGERGKSVYPHWRSMKDKYENPRGILK